MIPFAGNPLNRVSEKRTDPAWIEAQRCDPSSLILPLRRLEPLIIESIAESAKLCFLSASLIDPSAMPAATCVFLGLDDEIALFALDVSQLDDLQPGGSIPGRGTFTEARAAAQMISPKEAAILAQAKAMIDWHSRHGFCPRCGSPTHMMDAGYRRLCGACNAEHFPRVDPVVIMLATYNDACLVGRGKQFPPGMFSALAGFIEPGETIEEAVARELMEEASVRVSDVTYYATQPWPFPSSLMIGCFARAISRDAQPDLNELAELRWLERPLARELLRGRPINGLRLPPPIAIAHHLLKAWAQSEE